ncbi:MAG: tRNA (adenosine(37)-N6)-threonylcarbamoyltransferase complex dimerization subunit type 1 TsaB [Acidobacteriota bacterium]|nr:MAG: tRNA (adenosine(37)-N6)-threonylcarbamoyltransferase complex dimerization subunit type 1 TsaB [Acidobacteriota bacterium]
MSNKRQNDQVPRTESVILAVDTTAPRMSIVIARGVRLLAQISGDSQAPHSKSLFDNLTLALGRAGIEIEQVDLYAAVTGPGSFTGLRVGLAAVRGLAETTGKPSIGVNRFDLTALSAGVAGEILVFLEAGRSEIFAGLRRVDRDGNVTPLAEDMVGSPAEIIPEVLRSPDLILGSGRYIDEIAGLLEASQMPFRKSVAFDRKTDCVQLLTGEHETGAVLAGYALRLFEAGERPPLNACYVRPSDAELKAMS